MSNYNYTTDFLGKDSLSTGDADKIILGADFDFEFEKLVIAVNSKFDTTGGTFTGAVTGTDLTLTGAFIGVTGVYSGTLQALSISGGTF